MSTALSESIRDLTRLDERCTLARITFSKGMHLSNGGGWLLVHELTHAWQSEHGVHRVAYIGKSIVAQLAPGDAYAYQPGKNWEDYNPEQQASILEDWYLQDGQSSSSQLFSGKIRIIFGQKKISPDNRIEYPL